MTFWRLWPWGPWSCKFNFQHFKSETSALRLFGTTRRTWGECLSPDEWKWRGVWKATCNSHVFKKHRTELHGRVMVDKKAWFKTIPNLNAFLCFHISGFARPWLSLLLDISKSKADKGHRYWSYVLRCVAINLCLPSWTHDLGTAVITAHSSSSVSWTDSLTLTLPADLQVTQVVDPVTCIARSCSVLQKLPFRILLGYLFLLPYTPFIHGQHLSSFSSKVLGNEKGRKKTTSVKDKLSMKVTLESYTVTIFPKTRIVICDLTIE